MQIFPISVDLEVQRSVHFHAHHAAILYAAFAEAQGLAEQTDPHPPDGLMFTAVEQARLHFRPGDSYCLGITTLAEDLSQARSRLHRFLAGFSKLGSDPRLLDTGLRGNFRIRQLQSLAPARSVDDDVLQPLDADFLKLQAERLQHCREVTIKLVSPLRCERPRHLRTDGGTFLNERLFLPHVFLRRAGRRLQELGFPVSTAEIDERSAELVHNDTLWVDLTYGSRNDRKALGGLLGDLTLRIKSPELAGILVLAQYVAVGEKTRWGFGQFRIRELAVPQCLPQRSIPLLHRAIASPALLREAERKGIESGEMLAAVSRIHDGTYEPLRSIHWILPASRPDSNPRLMSVPHTQDAVLQTAVLEEIGPALDLFFEESSLAYRRGLGRQRAAQRLRAAYQRGFEWAVRSDIHRFFDSVSHTVLRRRLDASLQDDITVDLIMKWITSGSPVAGRGLPTGAPLSPLLANLVLDRFDEVIEQEGGHLVRYADDFLILFRRREDAEPLLQAAAAAASQLCLHLNREKTAVLSLRQPFQFLGYQFEHRDSWEFHAPSGVQHVNDLGWHQQKKATAPQDIPVLQGEALTSADSYSSLLLLGPDLNWLGIRNQRLVAEARTPAAEESWPLPRVREIVIIGTATLDDSLFSSHQYNSPTIWLTTRMGEVRTSVCSDKPLDNARLLTAQLKAIEEPVVRLQLSKALIEAKLRNYAALSDSVQPRRDEETGGKLRQLADRAVQADSILQLQGCEGAAAALWYGSFAAHLNPRFSFPRRVAPNADDPVNILLNIGFSWLHRIMETLLLAEGFAPSAGILHEPRAGRSSLASDMMEPFRHLIDRIVIAATHRLTPGDFQPGDGDYALTMHPAAVRRFLQLLHESFLKSCTGQHQTEPRSYRQQMHATVRSLHRHLLNSAVAFRVFRHS